MLGEVVINVASVGETSTLWIRPDLGKIVVGR